jgi:hypothetical protein
MDHFVLPVAAAALVFFLLLLLAIKQRNRRPKELFLSLLSAREGTSAICRYFQKLDLFDLLLILLDHVDANVQSQQHVRPGANGGRPAWNSSHPELG